MGRERELLARVHALSRELLIVAAGHPSTAHLAALQQETADENAALTRRLRDLEEQCEQQEGTIAALQEDLRQCTAASEKATRLLEKERRNHVKTAQNVEVERSLVASANTEIQHLQAQLASCTCGARSGGHGPIHPAMRSTSSLSSASASHAMTMTPSMAYGGVGMGMGMHGQSASASSNAYANALDEYYASVSADAAAAAQAAVQASAHGLGRPSFAVGAGSLPASSALHMGMGSLPHSGHAMGIGGIGMGMGIPGVDYPASGASMDGGGGGPADGRPSVASLHDT